MSQQLAMASMQSLCLPPATPALSKAMPPKKCFTVRKHARQQDELTALATFSATLHQPRESSQQSRLAQAQARRSFCAKRQRTDQGQTDSEGEQHLCIMTVVRNVPASSNPWCVRLPSGALLLCAPAWCHLLLAVLTAATTHITAMTSAVPATHPAVHPRLPLGVQQETSCCTHRHNKEAASCVLAQQPAKLRHKRPRITLTSHHSSRAAQELEEQGSKALTESNLLEVQQGDLAPACSSTSTPPVLDSNASDATSSC